MKLSLKNLRFKKKILIFVLLSICFLVFLFYGMTAMDENVWFLANFIEGPYWAFFNLMVVHLDFILMVSPTLLLIFSHTHQYVEKLFILVFFVSIIVLNLQPDLAYNGYLATGIVFLLMTMRSCRRRVFFQFVVDIFENSNINRNLCFIGPIWKLLLLL